MFPCLKYYNPNNNVLSLILQTKKNYYINYSGKLIGQNTQIIDPPQKKFIFLRQLLEAGRVSMFVSSLILKRMVTLVLKLMVRFKLLMKSQLLIEQKGII
jgi:hypothetical protein